MEDFFKDVRYGFRMLLKKPGFSAVAIATLALGIGLNSAIFSVVNAIVLSPLPFGDSERLVLVVATVRRDMVERRGASYPDFLDWRDQNQVFEGIAAVGGATVTLTGESEPERVPGELVSPAYFSILGVDAAVGRVFSEAENAGPEVSPVVLLSHELWQRRFGADRNLIGQTVQLNGVSTVAVGIMPEGFRGVAGDSDLWMPFEPGVQATDSRLAPFLDDRGVRWLTTIARLKPQVTLEQAQAELDGISHRLEAEYPDSNENYGAEVAFLDEEIFGVTRSSALLLMGAVGFVLLIACANVANLLLARAAGRGREVAVRLAVGASRARLVRQLLTESLLLALLGGMLGVLLALWGIDLLAASLPMQLPSYLELEIDRGVLGFTLLLSVVTGLIFGLVPALQLARSDLNRSLTDSGRATQGARASRVSTPRGLLVVTEVALALVLLIGAGLVLRSFSEQLAIDVGLDTENLLTLRVQLPDVEYSPTEAVVFGQQLSERLESLPGVRFTGIGSDVPLASGYSAIMVATEEQLAEDPEAEMRVYRHRLAPGYFAAMDIPLVVGRDFDSGDTEGSPGVLIVSQKMASRSWPDENPLAKRVTFDGKTWLSVIGVIGNVRHRGLVEDPVNNPDDPDIYLALAQMPTREFYVVIRSSTDPSGLASSVRQEVQQLNPNLPVFDIATMDEIVASELSLERVSSQLLGLFGGLALLLAAIGIYGVMAHSVAERTNEIGIRLALGARAGDVIRLVVRQGMTMAIAGVVAGMAAALAITRLISGFLYGVSATDPVTFGVVSFLLATVSLVASWVPAVRATKIDPIVSLRTE